jgi:F0F1-type ATP synthase assembly protein I
LKQQRDDRSPLSVGFEWLSRITTVSLEMVLPGLFGHVLDRHWGTSPWLLILGTILGFIVGFRSLLRMTRPDRRTGDDSDD